MGYQTTVPEALAVPVQVSIAKEELAADLQEELLPVADVTALRGPRASTTPSGPGCGSPG